MEIQALTHTVIRSIFGVLLATLIMATSVDGAERPNIVVILVDDMGYSDLGCYGSEIETPRLDALASHGLRFSQFYNTAKCHSSRVSLLTGHEEPDRLKSMVDEWTRMTRDVLHALPNAYTPATPAQAEHLHPEWTNFDGMEPNRRARARSEERAGAANGNRTRRQQPAAAAERENFAVANHQAFVIEPLKSARGDGPMPWVWYAPTFAGRLPGPEEDWMIKRFHDRGIAIAGIDVGESYGSPAGRAVYQSLYEELTSKRGYCKKPVLLARSRGGLMLYSWAAEHPNSVGGIAGIYPVCNIESYPGLAKAAGAYEMTAEQLKAKLVEHNPIIRLAPLAKAKVPILHIHGDQDRVVPLEENSGKLASRYRKLGGPVEIDVIKGQGHNMWKGWFQSQKLTDFIVSRALVATTNAEVSPQRSKTAESLIASISKETLWRNRDGQSQTWFHPRVCMVPDTDNKPIALMTLQEIGGSDYFGQVHWSASQDQGRTWADPKPIPAFGREPVPGHEGLKAAVCDVTPQYHVPSKRVIALGHVVFYKGSYFSRDEQLPRYPIYALRYSDGRWSKRQILEWDDPRGAFIYSNNCGQRVVLPNGDVQMSFTFGPQPTQRMVSGVRAGFDGERLTVKQVGPPLKNPKGRGLLEPSVTQFGDKFWITIRAEDGRGYVSRSNDGLHWETKRAWSWEDGAPLEMSTTQQHWLTHSDGLFLIYTRRDDSNENVIRWRSPLWVAQVDTNRMCLKTSTERIVLPIVGDGVNEPDKVALMGNFNVTNVNPHESLVTVGEWIPRDGYRGDLLVARIRWSKPNRQPLW